MEEESKKDEENYFKIKLISEIDPFSEIYANIEYNIIIIGDEGNF